MRENEFIFEDRIFSKKPSMPVGNGITAIHVYATPMETAKERKNWGEGIPAAVRKLLIVAKTHGIKTYFYEDKKAWQLQDTRKVVPITGPRETLSGIERTGKTYSGRSYLEPWLELVYKSSKTNSTDRADRLRRNMVSAWDDNVNDYDLKNDFANARKPGSSDREQAVKLISIMRRNGWAMPVDIAAALTTKWKEIAKKEGY
jgi:hypothetical protein